MNAPKLVVVAASQQAGAQDRAEPLGVNARLLAAARAGSEPDVRALLAEGAHPGSRNRLGDTPLNLAARAGKASLARALLERGASPGKANLSGVTPLMVLRAAGAGE